MAAHYKLGRHCPCGTPVSDSSKTGNCLRCNIRAMNADPVIVKRRTDAFRKKLAEDPVERQRRAIQMKINKRNGMKNPEAQARVLAAALRNLPLAWTPEAKARQRAGQAAAAKRGWEKRLAWCPADRREEYHRLVRFKKLTSAQARKVILDSMSPFDRQMHALERGARLIANDAQPSGNQVVRRFG